MLRTCSPLAGLRLMSSSLPVQYRMSVSGRHYVYPSQRSRHGSQNALRVGMQAAASSRARIGDSSWPAVTTLARAQFGLCASASAGPAGHTGRGCHIECRQRTASRHEITDRTASLGYDNPSVPRQALPDGCARDQRVQRSVLNAYHTSRLTQFIHCRQGRNP